MTTLTKSASVLGLMMVGAMTATTVNVPLNWTINIGQTSVIVGDVVNSIFPGILSIGLLFLLMSLIRKGKRPIQLIVGIFAVAMIGALVGIF